jgi:hypothetical protein
MDMVKCHTKSLKSAIKDNKEHLLKTYPDIEKNTIKK